jgi:hypothetical protein
VRHSSELRVERLDDLPIAGRKAQHESEINQTVLLDLICKENGILSNGHLISGAELDDLLLGVAGTSRRAGSGFDLVALAG